MTVCSANITSSAVVTLHFWRCAHGWAECGRTQATWLTPLCSYLQHWWTFNNAVACGPQSSCCNHDIYSPTTYSTAPHLVKWDQLYMYLGCWRVPLLLAMMAMTTTVIIMMFCDSHDDVTMAFRAGEAGGYHRVGSRSLNSVYCVLLIRRVLLAYRKCDQIKTSSN